MDLFFVVRGTPVPQGSTRAFIPKGWTRPVITAANSKTKPWKQEISGTAVAEMSANGFSKLERQVPVKISAWFHFPRPRHLPRRVEQKTTKPDLDKLVRSLLDALTGVVFEDDSQVVEIHVSKHFGDPEMRVRVEQIGSPVQANSKTIRKAFDDSLPF